MNIKLLTNPGVAGRYDDRTAVDVESDVADEPFVENLENEFMIIKAAGGQALKGCAIGFIESGHKKVQGPRSKVTAG
jgi:hypothetical protein